MKNLLAPFTSPTAIGVAVRYFFLAATPLITMLGWLTPEQIADLQAYLGQPELAGAVAFLIGAAIYVYGVLTKSHSVKAAAVATEIDKEVPESEPVRIETPEGVAPPTPIIVTEEGKVLK